MIKFLVCMFFVFSLTQSAMAVDIYAPEVPSDSEEYMADNTESFGEGLLQSMKKAVKALQPDLTEGIGVCSSVFAAVMIISILQCWSDNCKISIELAGSIAIASILLGNTNSMIHLGSETVHQMSDYGKLLYPVMATALAAQGGVTSSAALYTGTALFNTILSSLISKLLVPMVYLFLAFGIANGALEENLLKQMRDLVKNIMSWTLKTILMVFTTYMSITGVVSGTTDAAALKATKVTLSTLVPVVGGILSDASEAVLVSAATMKNAAGIYGILAVLAVFLAPFLKIGIHYLLLKVTAGISALFGPKRMTALIEDFSTAMGLLLAMTGSVCLLLLISTVCFMKGVN